MGYMGDRCIVNGRLLSDGVGNAYVVDVWAHSDFRGRGIAQRINQMLIDAVPGQHVCLFTDAAVGLYEKLGFNKQDEGMSIISGDYLQNETREV